MINLIMIVMSKRSTNLSNQYSNSVEVTRQFVETEIKLQVVQEYSSMAFRSSGSSSKDKGVKKALEPQSSQLKNRKDTMRFIY